MKTDEQVLLELEQAASGLLFMSESDYPFETVRWEALAEVTPEHLRAATGSAPEATVATESVADFFRVASSEADWKSAGEIATARRYQTLARVLLENLADVRVYRIGEVNIPVLIVGRNASTGNWLGLSTRVVET
jgi:hypothetical protein